MGKHYILLVEDNPDDEELTLLSLRKQNAVSDIVVTRDGVEALEFLFGEGSFSDRDSAQLPAVILLDLKLPKLDGLGVLRRLREDARTRHVPVVILSSSSQDADIVASYSLGANSYVRKPVEFRELTDTVSKVAEYWMTVNRPTTGR